MKKVAKIINGIAVAVLVLSGLCLDSSDMAIKLGAISVAYLALYTFRWEIARAVYKAIRSYVDAFKNAKAGGRNK